MIRWTMVAVLLVAAGLMIAGLLGVPGVVGDSSPVSSAIFTYWPLAYLAMTVLVIVDAVRRVRRGTARALVEAVVAVKLAGLLFLGLTAVVSVALGTTAVQAYAPLAFLVVPGLILLTTAFMLPTSIYGIAGVARLRRGGTLGDGLAWVLVLLHLMLVTDVVASIVVARLLHTRPTTPPPDPRGEWDAYQRLQQRLG